MVDMGNVWDRTTEFLSENVVALLPIAVAALLIPHSVNALIGRAGEAVNPLVGGAIGLICVLIALWGQLVVVALALDPNDGRPRAAASATRNFGRSIAAMLLVFAVLMVLAVPILGVLAASGGGLSALHGSGMAKVNLSMGSAVFVSLYTVVLFLLAVVVTVRLTLLYPVVIAEGGVITALRRSAILTRGIFWPLLGVWLLFVIVYLVASAAATTAIGAVIGLIAGPPGPFGFGNWVVAILGGLVTTAFTLVTGAFSAKLYRAVTTVRDGAPEGVAAA